ncbi:hypothetical protein [Bacillus sp. ISL-7]
MSGKKYYFGTDGKRKGCECRKLVR